MFYHIGYISNIFGRGSPLGGSMLRGSCVNPLLKVLHFHGNLFCTSFEKSDHALYYGV